MSPEPPAPASDFGSFAFLTHDRDSCVLADGIVPAAIIDYEKENPPEVDVVGTHEYKSYIIIRIG